MSELFNDTGYEAPKVTEESLDSGGNYVSPKSEDGLGTLGSTGDPFAG